MSAKSNWKDFLMFAIRVMIVHMMGEGWGEGAAFPYRHHRLGNRICNDYHPRGRTMRKGAKQQRAKALRRAMTDAEMELWRYLRDRRALGWKFRRQHPIGPFIVDFVCLEAGLIVEADGGQHAELCRDAGRDRYLQGCGFRVLRFWNHEILGDTDAVCDRILVALPQRTQAEFHISR